MKHACDKEAALYCQKDVDVLVLLKQHDAVEPKRIQNVEQRIHSCLLSHVEVLSSVCVHSLVLKTNVVSQPSIQPTGDQEDSDIEIRIFLLRNHHSNQVAIPMDNHVVLWSYVLLCPFICIGFYVSARYVLSYLRRQRDVVHRVTHEYQPISKRGAI